MPSTVVPAHGLVQQGLATPAALHWNLLTGPLVELAVQRGEGLLSEHGALVVKTGKHTGRSANDKFIVRDAATDGTIWWDKNKSITPEQFAAIKADFETALKGKSDLFVQDLFGGSQPEHRVKVRVITE